MNPVKLFSFSTLGLLLVSACGQDNPVEPIAPDLARKPPPRACTVSTERELMITATSVVDDPLRTTWATDPATDPRAAGWTFGRVMEKLAGSAEAPAMVRHLLDSWLADQTVNGLVVAARPKMATKVIDPWRAVSGGAELGSTRDATTVRVREASPAPGKSARAGSAPRSRPCPA